MDYPASPPVSASALIPEQVEALTSDDLSLQQDSALTPVVVLPESEADGSQLEFSAVPAQVAPLASAGLPASVTPEAPTIEFSSPQSGDRQADQPAESPTTPPSQPPAPALESAPTSEPVTPPASQTIPVEKIQVTGSTILSAKELDPLTQPLEGQAVPLSKLQELADQITQIYLDRGYLTSRAIVGQQTIQNGVVTIQVLEGRLERIDIEGTRRLKPGYVRSRVLLGAGTPLNATKLEDQLKLLRADPLFKNVEASLRAGTQPGQSILIVRVTEANPFEGNLSADNYSPPSVGSEQLGVNLSYRNLTGIGDQIFGSYSLTTRGGGENIGLAYRVPLNPMNGTLQLRANWTDNKIVQQPFDVLDIRGESELYELSYRQPIVRSPREEFALSLAFAYQNGQTFSFNSLPTPFGIGPDADGVSRTSVIKFGQDYLRRDTKGAWSVRSQFNFGTGLFDATQNPGDIPDGQFFSWLGQVQRVQRLSNSHLLILQADLQLTPDSLLPSQQFVIGGGQSVRGYRQNARSGDNGFRLSAEDRITIQRDANGSPTLQLAPFVEMGAVWNVSGNPNKLPDQTFLPTIGLGLLWQPIPRMSVRLDYGVPLVSLRDRGKNLQDDGVYFSVNYQF